MVSYIYMYLLNFMYMYVLLYYLRCLNRDNFLQIMTTSHSVCGMGNGNLENGSNRFNHTAFTNETDHLWLNKLQFTWAGDLGRRELYLQVTLHMNELQVHVHVKEMKIFNLTGFHPEWLLGYIHVCTCTYTVYIQKGMCMSQLYTWLKGKEEKKLI